MCGWHKDKGVDEVAGKMQVGESGKRSLMELEDITNVRRDGSAGGMQGGIVSSADLLELSVD